MYLTYLVQENKHRELGKMRRQGNMLQMKKQAKPQKKNESRDSNLTDKGFKVMIKNDHFLIIKKDAQ